jgi:hypothetical protein
VYVVLGTLLSAFVLVIVRHMKTIAVTESRAKCPTEFQEEGGKFQMLINQAHLAAFAGGVIDAVV